MTREIPLTQGFVALVDDEDYEWLTQYKWYAWVTPHAVYACRSVWVNKKCGRWYMHKKITGYPRTDHKNGNGLDNRRGNLREATALQNSCNMRSKGTTSDYVGVSWNTRERKWIAQIRQGGKHRRIGRFDIEVDAARAYDKAAFERDPEFFRPNFPEEYGR